ncbi:MAG: hypothetical protein ABI333_17235 [bacterium]
MRKYKSPTVAVLTCMALIALGCGDGLRVVWLSAESGMGRVESDWSDETGQPPRVNRDVTVTLQATNTIACVARPPRGALPTLVHLMACESFNLRAQERGAAVTEIKGYLKQQGLTLGWLLTDFGIPAGRILQKRLAQRFRSARVGVSPAPQVPGPVSYKLKFSELGAQKNAAVTLAATLPDGSVVTAEGRAQNKTSAGHIAWMILVVLFAGILVGLPIIGAAARGLHKKALERAIMMAVDAAAKNLAAKLATAPLGGPAAAPLSLKVRVLSVGLK